MSEDMRSALSACRDSLVSAERLQQRSATLIREMMSSCASAEISRIFSVGE